MTRRDRFYPILVSALSEEEGGGFIAIVPDLHGCVGDGETPEAAVSDAINAIGEWCAEMQRLGRSIPRPGAAAGHVRAEIKRINETIGALKEGLDQLKAKLSDREKIISSQNREISSLWRRIADLQETLREFECDDVRPSGKADFWTHAELAKIPEKILGSDKDGMAH